MRHRVAGRKLGRTTSHRVAMLRNMSTSLIEHEKITTTLAKAKELSRFTEKLVTLSKKETLHARRRALRQIRSPRMVAKLFDTLSARFSHRPGGYTRILKLGPRRGDNAEMALIEFVEAESPSVKDGEETKSAKSKKPTKRGKTAAADRGRTVKKKPAKKKATKKKTGKAATKKTSRTQTTKPSSAKKAATQAAPRKSKRG